MAAMMHSHNFKSKLHNQAVTCIILVLYFCFILFLSRIGLIFVLVDWFGVNCEVNCTAVPESQTDTAARCALQCIAECSLSEGLNSTTKHGAVFMQLIISEI